MQNGVSGHRGVLVVLHVEKHFDQEEDIATIHQSIIQSIYIDDRPKHSYKI